ncbi:MAG: response regulator transcription factor, partial [Oscillospiraceae bacterium]|nr:response regulator transcription factor [Oscillospiraceae bacterium]
DDYIAKPFGIMELAARVRSMFRRVDKTFEDDGDFISISDLVVDNLTREVRRDGRVVDLTYKEYELLGLLVRERGRIVPRDELLNIVWGFDFVGETRTLDTHIRTLRQKLGDDADNPRYIKTIRNVGYRFIGKDEI